MQRWPLLLAIVVCLASCKKRSPTDTLPADEATQDDMLAEMKRVEKGESVGEALRGPKVVLDARGVVVNERVVVPAAEIDAKGGASIDKLRTWLKGLREHWKTIHPGQDLDAWIDLTVPGTTPAAGALAVLGTRLPARHPHAH